MWIESRVREVLELDYRKCISSFVMNLKKNEDSKNYAMKRRQREDRFNELNFSESKRQNHLLEVADKSGSKWGMQKIFGKCLTDDI